MAIDLNLLSQRLAAGDQFTPDELKEAIAALRAGRGSAAQAGQRKTASTKKAQSAAAVNALLAALNEGEV